MRNIYILQHVVRNVFSGIFFYCDAFLLGCLCRLQFLKLSSALLGKHGVLLFRGNLCALISKRVNAEAKFTLILRRHRLLQLLTQFIIGLRTLRHILFTAAYTIVPVLLVNLVLLDSTVCVKTTVDSVLNLGNILGCKSVVLGLLVKLSYFKQMLIEFIGVIVDIGLLLVGFRRHFLYNLHLYALFDLYLLHYLLAALGLLLRSKFRLLLRLLFGFLFRLGLIGGRRLVVLVLMRFLEIVLFILVFQLLV